MNHSGPERRHLGYWKACWFLLLPQSTTAQGCWGHPTARPVGPAGAGGEHPGCIAGVGEGTCPPQACLVLSQCNHILRKHRGGVGGGGVRTREEGKAFQDHFTRLVSLGILSFTLCFVAALQGKAS